LSLPEFGTKAMPELPEVETVRRGLAPVLVGARLVRVEQRRPDLRFPFPVDFVRRLEGQRIEALERRAKYLLMRLQSNETVLMHLGMSGRFLIEIPKKSTRNPEKPQKPGHFYQKTDLSMKHEHVVFHTDEGARIGYVDPRRFGFMTVIAPGQEHEDPLLRDLGVEPLSNHFDAEVLGAALAGSKSPLKSALLDQKRIAGLGNIYVCEALHRAGLSPLRAAGTLADKSAKARQQVEGLALAIRTVLQEAVEAGGSSLKDFAAADGSLGYFQHRFRVYDQEGAQCPTKGCGGVVTRLVQAGRSTFYCTRCQR
jgi:formamidopyrimidine-DNA glycosylase